MSTRFETTAWSCEKAGSQFKKCSITRRAIGENDVHIAIKYASICHSDIHQANGDWGKAIYPMVPGHEIAGIVAGVGKNVKKFKIGDHAGIGCMIDSCRNCKSCNNNQENYCKKGAVLTYNSRMKFAHCPGYSEDPEKNPLAKKYSSISFDEALKQKLSVMDLTAFTLCQENNLPIMVFNMNKEGNLTKICEGKNVGTIVES